MEGIKERRMKWKESNEENEVEGIKERRMKRKESKRGE